MVAQDPLGPWGIVSGSWLLRIMVAPGGSWLHSDAVWEHLKTERVWVSPVPRETLLVEQRGFVSIGTSLPFGATQKVSLGGFVCGAPPEGLPWDFLGGSPWGPGEPLPNIHISSLQQLSQSPLPPRPLPNLPNVIAEPSNL
jgi:hypothetical protein